MRQISQINHKIILTSQGRKAQRVYNKGLVYTWRTFTCENGIATEPNTLCQKLFGSVTKTLSQNYTKRKVIRLRLFSEILRFLRFYARTLSKMNKS